MTVAPPSPPVAGLPAPLQLPWDLRLTPEQFERVCQANPDAVLELAADGQLIAMTPICGEAGRSNQTLGALLWLAVLQSGLPPSCSTALSASVSLIAPCSAPIWLW